MICHHNPTYPSHRSCSRTYHHFNNCYDSDSGIDLNVAINGEGPLELDEPDIPEVGASSSTSSGVSDEQNAGNFIDIPEEQLKKLKVVELKSELAKRGQQFQD